MTLVIKRTHTHVTYLCVNVETHINKKHKHIHGCAYGGGVLNSRPEQTADLDRAEERSKGATSGE